MVVRAARTGLALAVLLLGACQNQPAPEQPAAEQPQQRGMKLFHQGDYDGAIAAYQQALAKRPDDAVVYNLMGMAYRFKYNRSPSPELKQREIAAFKKAVELKPDFVVALVNLGASYYYSGDKPRAAEVFARVLKLAPHHPEAAQLKAMIAEGQSGAAASEQPTPPPADAAPAQSGR